MKPVRLKLPAFREKRRGKPGPKPISTGTEKAARVAGVIEGVDHDWLRYLKKYGKRNRS